MLRDGATVTERNLLPVTDGIELAHGDVMVSPGVFDERRVPRFAVKLNCASPAVSNGAPVGRDGGQIELGCRSRHDVDWRADTPR